MLVGDAATRASIAATKADRIRTEMSQHGHGRYKRLLLPGLALAGAVDEACTTGLGSGFQLAIPIGT